MNIWSKFPDLVDRLAALASSGYSASRIALDLGHGLTRSAVIGKAHRLGIELMGLQRSARRSTASIEHPAAAHFHLGWNSPFGRRDRHFFTAAEDRQIIRMVAENKTDAQIGQYLGIRETVIGGRVWLLRLNGFIHQHRHGRNGGRRPSRSAVTNLPLAAIGPTEPYIDRVDDNAPAALRVDGAPITLANVQPGQCRWPHGTPGANDFHLCGHQAGEGMSYCPYHRAVAYRKPTLSEIAAERPPKEFFGSITAAA